MHVPKQGGEQPKKGQIFVWKQCKLVLRKANPHNPKQEVYQNLEAEVDLESQQIQQPFIPLLRLQKIVKYDSDKDFNWKRGISLPPCLVKLQKQYFQLLKQDEEILLLYCEFTVTYSLKREEHMYLEEAKSIGDKKKKFNEYGEVNFSDVIIKESSLERDGSKYALLVTVCASSLEQSKIILKSLISSPFWVEDTRIVREKKTNKLALTQKDSHFVMKINTPDYFASLLDIPLNINIFNDVQEMNSGQIVSLFKDLNKRTHFFQKRHPFFMAFYYRQIFSFFYSRQKVKSIQNLLAKIVQNPDGFAKQNSRVKSGFVVKRNNRTKRIKKFSSTVKQQKKKTHKILFQISTPKKESEESEQPHKLKEKIYRTEQILLLKFNKKLLQKIQKQFGPTDLQQFNTQKNKFIEQIAKWQEFLLQVDFSLEPRQTQEFSENWEEIEADKIESSYKDFYDQYSQEKEKNNNNQTKEADHKELKTQNSEAQTLRSSAQQQKVKKQKSSD